VVVQASEGASARTIAVADRGRRTVLLLEQAWQVRRALVVAGATALYRRALFADGARAGRWLVLDRWSDFHERALRSAELQSGIYMLVVLSPDLVWSAGLVHVLTAWGPDGIFVDAGPATLGPYDLMLGVGALLARLRGLFPDAPQVLFCGVISPAGAGLVRGLTPDRVVPTAPLLDQVPFLSIRMLAGDQERLTAVRAALAGAASRVVVLAATRRGAMRIVEALQRDGHAPVLFHGGLSAAEQAIALAAYRDWRSPILVGTEALMVEPDLPAPDVLIASHPPRWLELVVALLAWSRPEAEVVLLATALDLVALERRVRADLPTLAQVRRVYRALRAQGNRGFALVDSRRLGLALGGEFAAHHALVRGALLLLERYGFLQRLDDFPRGGSLTLVGSPEGVMKAIAAAVHLAPGIPTPIEPLQLARAVQLSPAAFQHALIDADARGTMMLRAVASDALYALPTPPERGSQRLQAALRRLEERARLSSRLVSGFLAAHGCRLSYLSAVFGLGGAPACGKCDQCRGVAPRPSRARESDEYLALRALASIPPGIPPAMASRVVHAALVARGHHVDEQAVSVLLDDLVRRGLLARRGGSLLERVQVSEEGTRVLSLQHE
jgi:hypothetical protein